MSRTATTAIVVALMVLLIVGIDIAFFRHHFWPRLAVNVGVVLVALAFYVRFAKR
jgi:cytochrome c oxidase subunit IV